MALYKDTQQNVMFQNDTLENNTLYKDNQQIDTQLNETK